MRSIEEQLLMHEGLKLKPYRDTKGVLTIGVGRNLEAKGISQDEALFMLRNDIREAVGQLEQYDWYSKLDPIRQKVIVDMCFNLGLDGLLRFRKMIAAVEAGDFRAAADQMVNSAWYQQVGARSRRLERMMRTGIDYMD